MKKTLFLGKPVYRGLSWMGDGLKAFWMVAMKFYFSPTEKNLLISYWYDIRHFRRLKPGTTIDEFLDSRVQMIKREMTDTEGSARSRQLNGDLLLALKNKRIRRMFVSYLESTTPREGYHQVAAAIRAAWRLEGEDAEVVKEERSDRQGTLNAGEEDKVSARNEERGLNAKAYVIAAQLCFELDGKGMEFDAFSQNIPELIKFVRKQFGVEKLPGTFEKFKGYSYKSILKERSGSKKGQLKMPFRQIRDHPEIFGEEVAARAGEILKNNLR
jgi:hypothetical protein